LENEGSQGKFPRQERLCAGAGKISVNVFFLSGKKITVFLRWHSPITGGAGIKIYCS